jgi:quinol-cytochrome oxidoreductase complex cytochrome b subunit
MSVEEDEKKKTKALRSRPFWPGFALEEMSIAFFVLGLALMLASVLHPSQIFEPDLGREELRGLEYPADPFNTPPRVLPEWYFLAVFELLKLMAPWLAFVLLGLFALGFVMTPFIERFMSKRRFGDLIMKVAAILIVGVFLYFTFRGMGLV